jgi:hypothetical protein
MLGHPDVGTHSGLAPIRFWGCWSDKEFESTPGSQSSGANPEETSGALVVKSIRWREFEKLQIGSPEIRFSNFFSQEFLMFRIH